MADKIFRETPWLQSIDTPAVAGVETEQNFADPTSVEISDYIADMLQDLRELAKSGGHAALGTLLELAEREARQDRSEAQSNVVVAADRFRV